MSRGCPRTTGSGAGGDPVLGVWAGGQVIEDPLCNEAARQDRAYTTVCGRPRRGSPETPDGSSGQAQAVEACASTSSVNSSEGFFQL